MAKTNRGVGRPPLVTYFSTPAEALRVRDRVRDYHPEARIVYYLRGWAVQYYKSGPYYPAPL